MKPRCGKSVVGTKVEGGGFVAPEMKAYEADPVKRAAETKGIDTPRGTWAILLGYAVILAGLWLYGYIELLIRR